MTANDLEQLFASALRAHLNGELNLAAEYYEEILKHSESHPGALHHLGLIYLHNGKDSDAISLIQRSLKVSPKQPDALSNLGHCLNNLSRHREALAVCKDALDIDPENDGAYTNLGNAQRALGFSVDSENSYKEALRIQPNNPNYVYNLANIIFDREHYGEAVALFEQCLSIEFNIPEAHNNLSACLLKLKNPESALIYIEQAIKLRPGYTEAWINRGNALTDLRRHTEALESYKHALELKPDYAEAWINYGNALSDLKRYEEALTSYEQAIQLEYANAEAWHNRGTVLNSLKKHEDALDSYERAIKLKPNLDFLLGNLIHTQMKICNWTELTSRQSALMNGTVEGAKVSIPFPILGLFDSPELQKTTAETYARAKLLVAEKPEIVTKEKSGRIRLGYFSMDFREHPVSTLIADLLERHDRTQFEIFGFSFGIDTRDLMRQRLELAFDEFYDVRSFNDLEIAKLSRSKQIDIAIDLGGFTQDSRPQIFANRLAPIQINYLGYPGTMGTQAIDYLIADSILIPKNSRAYYSEKIIYLPHCYQANDSKRKISDEIFNREQLGLPANKFVFCCFNNNWKILPETFELWIRILRSVEKSVLWLFEDNPTAAYNIQNEAKNKGLCPDRILFAKFMDHDRHLARYKFADLFLDTFPYNGHTTASDALWAGTPVLTRAGESFPSRVAASLLTNLGLPELITQSAEEYVSQAIELANNPQKLASIRKALHNNRSTSPVFNTVVFAKNIERAYRKIYNRYHAGLPPDHVYVEA